MTEQHVVTLVGLCRLAEVVREIIGVVVHDLPRVALLELLRKSGFA